MNAHETATVINKHAIALADSIQAQNKVIDDMRALMNRMATAMGFDKVTYEALCVAVEEMVMGVNTE